MAHQRRSPQHRTIRPAADQTLSTHKHYPLRRAPSRTSSHAPTPHLTSPAPRRPVLVPLHNLRRLPSRALLADGVAKAIVMRESSHPVQIGVKRKRVASSNENVHAHSRPTRSSQKRKRSTNSVIKRCASTSEESESEASEMELDPPARELPADNTDSEEEEEEEEEGFHDGEETIDQSDETDSTDDYLLYTAPHSQLNRLKKGDLVRLYKQGSLPEDPELLTKAEIIEVIIDARQEETASLPPSSPPGRTDASSDYSSDDGNVAGDEQDDGLGPSPPGRPGSALRRRATIDIAKTPARPTKGRSLSLGTMLHSNPNDTLPTLKRKASLRINTDTSRNTNRSSPSTSTSQSASSHAAPGHRLRSRKVSAPTLVEVQSPASSNSKKDKGKAKQVEFSDEVVESRRHSKDKQREKELAEAFAEESDLTELDELERQLSKPSPRRLRSRDRELPQELEQLREDGEATPIAKRKAKARAYSRSSGEQDGVCQRPVRITPMRRAKGKIKSLRMSDLEMASGDEEGKQEGPTLEKLLDQNGGDEPGDDTNEETEVDELISSASFIPSPALKIGRRLPLHQRLRQRKATSSNGDEENEGDDEHEAEEEADDVEVEADDETEEMEDEESTTSEEPRRLRNGKIVGDEDVQMDENDVAEEELAEGEAEDEQEEGEDGQDEAEDEQMDGEDEEVVEDQATDDEVDLTVATAKTLTRLRKDDLVRLCESRNLEPVGNKRKLAEALLHWRDRQANAFSSPSSTGTIRPPSTTTKRGRKNRSSSSTVPLLLRSQQVHADEPRTPVPEKERDEPELELDLESLGLEDREIPPEKIQKLEKIGSGGFKDVFIGKFKGRRIAISEFRGTLSAMDIKELKLLGGFDHPNIVRFLGVSIPENTKETPVMIVSELCSNGDLFDYVRNVSAPSLHKVLRMMLDIAYGLEYLHMRTPSVIHRDCKSSNILITAKGIAKIADFGLAKVKESTRSMVRSLVGTVNWQAPELWTAHPNYNHKVDVFSCAMVFWETLQWHVPNKKFPWEGMNEHAIYDVVGAKKQRPSLSGLRKQWCPEIIDLMEQMWAQDPRDRPTMSEVVATLRELVTQY